MPRNINGFKIIGKSQGGMAVVYHGEKNGYHRAFKVVRPDKAIDNPRLCQKFNRSILNLQKLTNEHIVRTMDAFTYKDDEDGRAYTVLEMEWIFGMDLQKYVKTRYPNGMPVERMKPICLQAIDGFIYAHSRGIMHLDIKPSNIMVTDSEFVKIIDFGISKVIGESPDIIEGAQRVSVTQTATGESTFRGTIAYASPEQWNGFELDKRSDVFSFGRTMRFMLTGSDVFDAPIKNSQMQEIIAKCCANERPNRYQSFEELKQALLHEQKVRCVNSACKAMLPKGTKFCPECGRSQTGTPPPPLPPLTKKCICCGKFISAGSGFCEFCGTSQSGGTVGGVLGSTIRFAGTAGEGSRPTTKKCVNVGCGRQIPLDSMFCEYCGAIQKKQPQKTVWVCSSCGNVDDSDYAKFCIKCGKPTMVKKVV